MKYNYLNSNWLISRDKFRELFKIRYNEFARIQCFDKTEFVVLTMTVMCKFVSVEEFVVYFRMKPSQVNNIFKNLMDKEMVETVKIVNKSFSRVSRTDTLYTYTKTGYEVIKNSEVGEIIYTKYRFVKENPKNLHDYVNGMNLFGVISSIEPYCKERMGWDREQTYGDSRRAENTLSIDGYLALQCKKQLLFETDLNNESVDVLLDKLDKYCIYPDEDSPFLNKHHNSYIIVFSCYFPNRLDDAAFVQKNIRAIAEQMKGLPDNLCVSEYYEMFGKHLEPDLEATLRQIMEIRIGIDSDEGTAGSEMIVYDFREMATRYAIENPFYINAYNRIQYLKTRAKKRLISNKFVWTKCFGKKHEAADKGAPIYVVPTVLLGNYIGFISDFTRYFNKIASCLEKYYGKINFSEYKECMTFSRKDYSYFYHLRNCFMSEKGRICVEYHSIDIGVMRRAYFFHREEREKQQEEKEDPIHLIVIVDEVEDAYELSMRIGDYKRHQQFIMKDGNAYYKNKMEKYDILYLLKRDLERGEKEALFFYSGYEQYFDEKGKAIEKDNEYHRVIPQFRPANNSCETAAYYQENIPF